MRRALKFFPVFAAAPACVQYLPLYVERTLVRSWGPGTTGDAIEWGWRLRTLAGFWSDYAHMRPEQRPSLWLAVNFALALAYALLVAAALDRLLARRAR